MTNFHDAYVQRFTSLTEPVHIRKLDPKSGKCEPWFTILPQEVLPELVIRPDALRHQIDTITVAIGWWSRLSAHTRRVLDVQERHLRSWQAGVELAALVEAKAENEKAPTQRQIEAKYRGDDEYRRLTELVEEAQEAHNAVEGFADAFREKARLLSRDVYRGRDGTLERWSP